MSENEIDNVGMDDLAAKLSDDWLAEGSKGKKRDHKSELAKRLEKKQADSERLLKSAMEYVTEDPSAPGLKKLTPFQTKVVAMIGQGYDQTEAWIRAKGLDPKRDRNKIPKTATQQAYSICRQPHVRDAIERIKGRQREILLNDVADNGVTQAGMAKQDILNELIRVAYSPEAKDADKLRSLELLGKTTGLFKETADLKDIHKQVFKDGFDNPLSAINHYLGVLSDRFISPESVDTVESLGLEVEEEDGD